MEDHYVVQCHNCRESFDAAAASWCSCLATERSLVCPSCESCFCAGPTAYKGQFWRDAPGSLRKARFEEHGAAPVPDASAADDGDASRPLVLVVDDEGVIRRIATHVIRGLGYRLLVGHDGAEGLELARKHRPDLILTDALMPGLDGRELCRRVKADPDLAGTKVVVMTGLYTSVKYEMEAHKAFGVDAYLPKPVDIAQLRKVLEAQLGAIPLAS